MKFHALGGRMQVCSDAVLSNDTFNKNIGPKGEKKKNPVGACQYVVSKHGSKNDF